MKEQMNFSQNVGVQVSRRSGPSDSFNPKGTFEIEVICGKTGKVKHKETVHNVVANVGKNYALDAAFRPATSQLTWYIGLVDNSGWTAFAAGDTMSSHAGWAEFTSYDESARQAWGPSAAASQSISNSAAASFTVNGSGTLKGIFVTSDNTISGTAGTLWAGTAFSTTIPVSSSDVINVTYTVSAS